jgi:transcriptional regulator with XRE-family HTH domain
MSLGEHLKTIDMGGALQEIRLAREMTQHDLCRKAGISINFLSQVENGRKGVSPAVAERIARALVIPVSFLYLLADHSGNPLVEEMQDAVRASLSLRQPVS